MQKRSITRPSRTKTIYGDFPVTVDDLEEFERFNNDNTLVEQFAQNIKNDNPNYKEITDDKIICILYIKKSSKTNITRNITSGLTTLNIIINTTTLDIPLVNSITTSAMKNVDALSNFIVKYFPPNNELPRGECEERTKYIICEKTNFDTDFAGILRDVGVPPKISNSFGDIVKGGITTSNTTSIITNVLEYFISEKTNIDGFDDNFYKS